MSDPFSIMLDTLFATAQAIDATYIPKDGPPQDVRGAFTEPDVEIPVAGARIRDQKRVLEIRKSELAAVAGDAPSSIARLALCSAATWRCAAELMTPG